MNEMDNRYRTATLPVDSATRVRESIGTDRLRQRMSDIFKLLADPTRLEIVSALLEAELCVGEISSITELSQSSVSHHLRNLREANLVVWRKQGKKSFYRLADSHVTALLAVARDHARESL